MAVSDRPSLADQLDATRQAVDRLSDAVDHLSRRYTAWRAVVVLVCVALAGVLALSLFVLFNTRHVEDELRDLGRNLFLVSCETSNDSREVLRDDSRRDTETIISLTNLEVEDPELAQEFREATQHNIDAIQDRDCQAELKEAGG